MVRRWLGAFVAAMAMPGVISPALGIEGREFLRDRGAEPQQHFVQYRIELQTQPASADLHRNMTIAQMVRDANQVLLHDTANPQRLLPRGTHLNDTSIVSQEKIVVAQYRAALEEQTHLLTRLAARAQPALLPQVELQDQPVVAPGARGAFILDD